MTTVDLLMPAAGDGYAEEAAAVAAAYAPSFADRGMTLATRPWTDGPGTGDATLALLAWGYHADPVRWQRTIDEWPADRLLINAPALLAWNTRKTYLRDLEAAGVPVVPSLFGDADGDSIAAAFDHFDVDTIVVKPQISAGSDRTWRVARGASPPPPLAGAIIQPFLPAVGGEGELSLFYLGGRYSHAARKVAAAGDFRIQPQFGGVTTGIDPSGDARLVADAALAAAPAPACYARVDLLRLGDGRLAVIELELIEPYLYHDVATGVADRLAAAVAAAIADRGQ